MKTKGIAYILTNLSMPNYIKIGVTTTTVQERMRSLDCTSVPLPFACHFAIEVNDVFYVEKLIHKVFKDCRTRKNREFFTISPESAVAALKLAGGKEIILSDNLIDETGKEVAPSTMGGIKRKNNFNFNAVGISIGAELVFTRDDNKRCKVISGNKVEYENKHYSLSGLSLRLLHELGYKWKTCRGLIFWKYKGTLLPDLDKSI